MLDYTKDHKELDYRFIKEIPSTTKVKAWHVKIGKLNYQIQCAPIPRLYEVIHAYTATRSGRIEDVTKPLVCINSSDLNEGAEELIAVLKGSPTREFHVLPKTMFN